MNSFLLAFTAVLILVLSALFAAPLFIDWNDYRPVFETQASKLLGRDVKVGGKVHMVLLPAPESGNSVGVKPRWVTVGLGKTTTLNIHGGSQLA